jgi:hypothetical protein
MVVSAKRRGTVLFGRFDLGERIPSSRSHKANKPGLPPILPNFIFPKAGAKLSPSGMGHWASNQFQKSDGGLLSCSTLTTTA